MRETVSELSKTLRSKPWLEGWPAEGLESVPACPACRRTHRETLYTDLVDKVFCSAPGRWTLYHCLGCGSAYLDPRPTQEFIHLAYRTYYTHQPDEPCTPVEALSMVRRFRHTLANGYTNSRYGTSFAPASRLGIAVGWLLPALRRRHDQQFRYLPRPVPGWRVLDVGSGNGSFLESAMSAGWQVSGFDTDETAAANAKARGLNVRRGGFETYADEPESFDAITLNHVIEHVHDPAAVLRGVVGLLKPGGTLYLATPNIESLGLHLFGPNWRGLEPPRHLVIFSRGSLLQLMKEVGLEDFRFMTCSNACPGMFAASLSLKNGKHPLCGAQSLDWKKRLFALRGYLQPSKQEFIIVLATKSGKR
jgi:2-polyprenyl-3-methyl-5-hydroxy-6-metoxy-1,4-benzoquinol methylase